MLRAIFYLLDIFRTSSLGDSISSNPEKTTPRRWEEEPGYIEVLQQMAGSLNIKILLFAKENQISQLKNFSAFLYIGRWKSLGSLKSFLWCVSQLSGAQILYFHILSSSGLTKGSACSLMAALLLLSHQAVFSSLQPHGLQPASLPCPSLSPWVGSDSCPLNQWCHPTISSSVTPFSCPVRLLDSRYSSFWVPSGSRAHIGGAAIPDDCDIFVSRYGRKSSMSQSRRAWSKTGAPRKEKVRHRGRRIMNSQSTGDWRNKKWNNYRNKD